jgi:hypothetical protein
LQLSVAALTLALAGCTGQAHPPAGPGSRASTPVPVETAAAAPAAIAAVAQPLVAIADSTSLSLVTLDGRAISQTAIPSDAWLGVGGGMATFVDHGQLKGLTRAGTVASIGPVADWAGGPVVVSPDGGHWMWSASSASDPFESALMLGTRGARDRVVARLTSQQSDLQPFRWSDAGPIYQQAARGLGGYILFGDGASGPSFRFDVATGEVTPVLAGNACHLADLAVDGTIACVRGPAQRSIDVLSPAGHVIEIPLPRPAFVQEGAVTFVPGSGSAKLVVGGATSAGASGAPERYETDVLDAGSRQLRPFGPLGLRPAPGPWSWLPDGSLVAYRPARSSGGDPGVYTVARDGVARKVLSAGTPLGVII